MKKWQTEFLVMKLENNSNKTSIVASYKWLLVAKWKIRGLNRKDKTAKYYSTRMQYR